MPLEGAKVASKIKRVDAVLSSFLSSGLSKAKTLIVNGCSAGGLSTYLHLDYIRSRVPATVK